jgi:hypothetical protein
MSILKEALLTPKDDKSNLNIYSWKFNFNNEEFCEINSIGTSIEEARNTLITYLENNKKLLNNIDELLIQKDKAYELHNLARIQKEKLIINIVEKQNLIDDLNKYDKSIDTYFQEIENKIKTETELNLDSSDDLCKKYVELVIKKKQLEKKLDKYLTDKEYEEQILLLQTNEDFNIKLKNGLELQIENINKEFDKNATYFFGDYNSYPIDFYLFHTETKSINNISLKDVIMSEPHKVQKFYPIMFFVQSYK